MSRGNYDLNLIEKGRTFDRWLFLESFIRERMGKEFTIRELSDCIETDYGIMIPPNKLFSTLSRLPGLQFVGRRCYKFKGGRWYVSVWRKK